MSLPDFLANFTRKKRTPGTPPINPEGDQTNDLLSRVGDAANVSAMPKPAGEGGGGQSLGEMALASWQSRQTGAQQQPDAASRPRRVTTPEPVKIFDFGPKPGEPPRPEEPTVNAYAPPQVPLSRKPRAAPAPELEDAEGEQMARRLDLNPDAKESPDAGTVSRPRVADVPGHLTKQLNYERANPAKDKNGRLKSIIAEMTAHALGGLARGGIGGAIGGGLVGAASGAIDPASDERRGQGRRVAQRQQQLGEHNAREKEKLGLEGMRADIGYKQEQTEYLRTGKRELDRARMMKQRQDGVLSQLGRLKGTKIDPATHGEFLRRYREAFGDDFDVEGYNSAKGNFVVRGLIDPDRPQVKQDVMINPVTGERRVLGDSSYTAPRDPQGWTDKERHTFGLTKERFEETRRMNALRGEEIRKRIQKMEEEMAGVTSSDKRAFDIETKGLFDTLKQRRADILKWEKLDKEGRVDTVHAQQEIEAIGKEVAEIEGRIEGACGRARPGGGRSRGGSSSVTYTEADVRARAKAAGRDPEAAVKAARASGLIK